MKTSDLIKLALNASLFFNSSNVELREDVFLARYFRILAPACSEAGYYCHPHTSPPYHPPHTTSAYLPTHTTPTYHPPIPPPPPAYHPHIPPPHTTSAYLPTHTTPAYHPAYPPPHPAYHPPNVETRAILELVFHVFEENKLICAEVLLLP